jgi:hypothetical protein
MIFIQLPLHYPCKNTKCRSRKKKFVAAFQCDLCHQLLQIVDPFFEYLSFEKAKYGYE